MNQKIVIAAIAGLETVYSRLVIDPLKSEESNELVLIIQWLKRFASRM